MDLLTTTINRGVAQALPPRAAVGEPNARQIVDLAGVMRVEQAFSAG
jgi:hypothetical protein